MRSRRAAGLATLLALAIGGVAASFVRDGQPEAVAAKPGTPATSALGETGVVPPPVPPRPPPEPPPPPSEPRVQIAAVGDITMGDDPILPPDGGRRFFAKVAPHLDGDIVLGNLETTLSSGGPSQCDRNTSASCFDFRVPPSYARLLDRAGFTVMNLANNHAYDYFASGRAETVEALDRVGLLHTGRPGEIAYEKVGPVRVAIVGFAPYEWAQDLLDLPAARRLVRKAGKKADLVVVTMHAGAEGFRAAHVPRGSETFLGEPRGNVRAFAHAVVRAGADLVVGHGPHVLRGMEWYRGRLIAYSLGNFSGWRTFSLGGPLSVSGILRVTLRRDGSWVEGELFSTRLVDRGVPVPDRERVALDRVRTLSRQDFGRQGVRINRLGVLRSRD